MKKGQLTMLIALVTASLPSSKVCFGSNFNSNMYYDGKQTKPAYRSMEKKR